MILCKNPSGYDYSKLKHEEYLIDLSSELIYFKVGMLDVSSAFSFRNL